MYFLKLKHVKSCKLPVRLDNNIIIWQKMLCWRYFFDENAEDLGEAHLVPKMAMSYQQGTMYV